MVKFDIISGFLGAGKTTFIRRLIQSLHNEKVVIIENEYGETSIDSETLRIAGFDIYELTNGCVCCTLKEEFRLTLKEILQEKVDRILFEPSGIFILDEIFDLFRDLQISSRCILNSVTTVVDATHFFKHKNGYSRFFTHQIASADSLVLSKTQWVSQAEIQRIFEDLREINPSARMLAKPWEELSPEDILSLLKPFSFHPAEDHTDGAEESTPFDHDFDTLSLRTSRRFHYKELRKILEMCQLGELGEVVRGKGILPTDKTFLEFNYVDGAFQIREIKKSSLAAVNFIGKNLKTQKIRELFGEEVYA